MADVVVLGSLNMDLVVRTARMPKPGETVPGEQFTTVPGGKGANQAAAAARLGASVEMIGCVGDDAFGPTILENLRAQGVGTEHVRVAPGASSGTAMIIVDERGENSIVVAPGANALVTVQDVEDARDLIAGARFLVMQFEIPLPVVCAAIEIAAEVGVPVILNAAPAHGIDADILACVPYVVVNEHEAEFITSIQIVDMDSARLAVRALATIGIAHPILTVGEDGALLAAAHRTLHFPARQVEVVDTTAAGDAFVGGLAAALLRGQPLEDAVRYATCAGTLATTVLGAQPSLPSAEQVDAFCRGGAR